MEIKGGRILTILAIGSLALFLVCPALWAADYPKKPVKLVVTAAAGGGEDMEARAIAPFVEKHLGGRITY